MVDTKELPKMKEDKKEREMADLFSNIDTSALESQQGNDNFSMKTAGPTDQLHDALGFMP